MFFPYRDENPSNKFPVFTLTLIIVNVWFYYQTFTPASLEIAVAVYGFTPDALIRRPYVLLSSTFLHAGLLHLASNMWFLWLYGDNIEDSFGVARFLGIYLLAGIIGNLVHMIFSGFQTAPVIGASGSVAGVMGAYWVRFPNSRIRCLFLLFIFPFFFRIPAYFLLGAWLVFEFLGAFLAPADHIAHWAHVGGFLVGLRWAWSVKKKGAIRLR